MRKSLKGIEHMVVPGKMMDGVPDELRPFEVYLRDSGHCILCIPEVFREEAKSAPDDYEVGVTTRWVLTHAYKIENGYVYVDVPYDDFLGVNTPEEYDQF